MRVKKVITKLDDAEKIVKKRENAKKRRQQLNANNAIKLHEEIQLNQAKLPQLVSNRNELEQDIVNKTLHKKLAAAKQELKSAEFYIASLMKTRNRSLPKTKKSSVLVLDD